jgi:autotransporter strand-loop-strand O-heptosyltransferase
MKNSFKVSYVTTLPKEANAPRVTITGNEDKTYKVYFYDLKDKSLVSSGSCKNNETIMCGQRQWFTHWYIEVHDEMDMMVFNDSFRPTYGKTVFIKMDSYALGDTIAWMPYVRAFKQKHKCDVICSTFHNNLFVEAYPDIMFVAPNTKIDNVYAQYYIGAAYDNNPKYCRLNAAEGELQRIASDILGLEYQEMKPELNDSFYLQPNLLGQGFFTSIPCEKYVTLSEFGSAENKHWKAEGGWQGVVDYLNTNGYRVVVISKEKTNLRGVIDLSGDFPLSDRIRDIKHARFHIGVSSGLSWLAWAVGTHVVLVSDVTPKFHEFSSNVTRIGGDDLERVNYESETQTSLEKVLEKLDELQL